MGLLTAIKTWANEILKATDLNNEFLNIYNNLDPDHIEDASANTTAMQATTDPYPGDVESLATDLRGEIQRLRYLIKQITGETQWYIDPDSDIAGIVVDIAAIEAWEASITASAAEINTACDGITATAAEINTACDGITATAAEINAAADGIGVTIPRQKILQIGDWNMDADSLKNVAHGLTHTKIRGVRGMIRDDTDLIYHTIPFGQVGYDFEVVVSSVDATVVHIQRRTSGWFDGSSYDSTGYNRGWIIIDYVD